MGYRRAPVFIGGFFFYPAAALYYRDGAEQQFNNLTYVLTSNTSFAEFDALNSSLFNSTGVRGACFIWSD
ncbi:hypothetical protein HaLaN_26540, partial [Haematococcus lacustris]